MTVAALECMVCGQRETYEHLPLDEFVQAAREMGHPAELNEARDAIAAVCPTCAEGDCPRCGAPMSEHQVPNRRVRCIRRPG